MEKEKKEFEKNNKMRIIIVAIVFGILICFICIRFFINGDISSVSRVLGYDYDSIKCVNADCDGMEATVKNKKDSVSRIINAKGKTVGKYSYKNKDKHLEIYDFSNKYFLMKKQISEKAEKYYITNKSGKELYSTNNKLLKISDNYVLEQIQAKIDYKYNILDSNGKLLYKNLTNYESYDEGNYIYIEKDDKNFILNTNNGKVFNKYKVKEEVKDEDDETLYLILTKDNTDLYYFFNIDYDEISSNGFRTYIIQGDKSLIVVRRNNNINTKYSISLTGSEKKISSSRLMSELIKDYSAKIDSNKYYLYTASIIGDNQKDVIVDSFEEKALGIYNIKNKKFEKLYEYTADRTFSSINELESYDGNTYIQISCDELSCGSAKTLVYNVDKSKVEFSLDNSDRIASDYIQYKNGYKVVKFSYKSKDDNVRGKYSLYDKNNKELKLSGKEIRVIDSENVTGKVENKSLYIYSKTKKKFINDEDNLADVVRINKQNYYEFTNSKKKKTIVNDKGVEIYSETQGTLEYTNDNIYAVTSNDIRVYSMKSNKISTYKFKENESTVSDMGKKVSPYNGAIFINNDKKKYVKVLNESGNEIRKIDGVTMFDVKTNEKSKRAFITVKESKEKSVKYGLFIAK